MTHLHEPCFGGQNGERRGCSRGDIQGAKRQWVNIIAHRYSTAHVVALLLNRVHAYHDVNRSVHDPVVLSEPGTLCVGLYALDPGYLQLPRPRITRTMIGTSGEDKLKKERETKDDGRYIIFYVFEDEAPDGDDEV